MTQTPSFKYKAIFFRFFKSSDLLLLLNAKKVVLLQILHSNVVTI